ncbi:MAG: hypothetical protein QY325_15305 [Flavobacteriales bacterium]|jgi:hypothetical protein|nr:MAG: hypothetical protein QY325_15305 [Flavobacteriales bacterium]
MHRLLRWILLVALPFVLLMGGVAWIDPFNYFDGPGPVPLETRRANLRHSGATMPHYTLTWKLIEYRRAPVADIIIGDSRLTRFDAGLVSSITGRPLYNFGVPGGNTPSMLRTFWYADSLAKLETVYLQTGFRNWSAAQDYDIWEGPAWAASSAVRYLTDRDVLGKAWLDARAHWGGVQAEGIADDQWAKVISNERAVLEQYAPAPHFATELRRVAERCRERGIRLVIIDLPVHDEVHRMEEALGLGAGIAAYKELMRSTAAYCDFAGPSAITADRAQYIDALHTSKALLDGVIREIWQGPAVNGTVSDGPVAGR